MDGDTTTTTMGTTRSGCNDSVSTAGETGLVFLGIRITKMVLLRRAVFQPQIILWRYVFHIPGNILEVYNLPNTRNIFASNFDTCAGSFDGLTPDPLLATGDCIRISDDFQQCNFGNYNSFAQGNI